MIRRSIALLTFAAVLLHAGQVFAQGAFPAPLPGQGAAPASKASPFEHRTIPAWYLGAPRAGTPPNECMKEFSPLREEAEKRGKLIKAAGERKAGPEEACKLIGDFGQAQIKMIKFVESNAARCGIPPQVAQQMKTGLGNTRGMQVKVCTAAREQPRRGPAGPVGDFWPAGSDKAVGDFPIIR
jgi:hypothetical protein